MASPRMGSGSFATPSPHSFASPRLDPSIEQPYIFMGKILENADDLMPQVLASYADWTVCGAR